MKHEMKRGQTRKVPEYQAKETQTLFWGQQGGSKHLRMATRYLASPLRGGGGRPEGRLEMQQGRVSYGGRPRGGDDRGRG